MLENGSNKDSLENDEQEQAESKREEVLEARDREEDTVVIQKTAPVQINNRAGSRITAIRLERGEEIGGRYVIEKIIGAGGVGAVYLAYDKSEDKYVALKMLHPDVGIGLVSLKKEKSAVAEISHSNIVKIIGHDLEGKPFPYIVMEYIRGVDLGEIAGSGNKNNSPNELAGKVSEILGIKKGQIPPLKALFILKGIIRGLIAVQEEKEDQVLHRDLKPSNILLELNGDEIIPKVTDFGLARTKDVSTFQNEPGSVTGTPFYMSPEQARGDDDLDVRTDIFSLGALLHHIVTGRIPAERANPADALKDRAEFRPLPQPVTHWEHIPGILEQLIMDMTVPNRESRIASYEELLERIRIVEDAIEREMETIKRRFEDRDSFSEQETKRAKTTISHKKKRIKEKLCRIGIMGIILMTVYGMRDKIKTVLENFSITDITTPKDIDTTSTIKPVVGLTSSTTVPAKREQPPAVLSFDSLENLYSINKQGDIIVNINPQKLKKYKCWIYYTIIILLDAEGNKVEEDPKNILGWKTTGANANGDHCIIPRQIRGFQIGEIKVSIIDENGRHIKDMPNFAK